MLRIFIGYDARQAVAFNVLQYSILSQASKPVSITPLVIDTLPITRTGLTPFTYSRFIVPYLCDYQGWALFLDCDMLVRTDINTMFELCDEQAAVMLVAHQGKLCFERSSVMLLNCSACIMLTPAFVNDSANDLLDFAWLPDTQIKSLAPEWNHLVGYDQPNPNAKILHYTQGIPCHQEVQSLGYTEEWFNCHKAMNQTAPWHSVMGSSVHNCIY